MCTLTKTCSFAVMALAIDLAAASEALAQEPGDACDVDEGDRGAAEPVRQRAAAQEHGSGYRAPGFLAGGIVTTIIGSIPAIAGVAFIADDQASHDDWLDGLGTTVGGILLGVGAVHLAVGIPLLVVGSEKGQDDEPAPTAIVTVGARPNGAELRVSF